MTRWNGDSYWACLALLLMHAQLIGQSLMDIVILVIIWDARESQRGGGCQNGGCGVVMPLSNFYIHAPMALES